MRRWMLASREDYGVHAPLEALRGGDAAFNAAALTAILEGERSPRRRPGASSMLRWRSTVAGAAENIVNDGMERGA